MAVSFALVNLSSERAQLLHIHKEVYITLSNKLDNIDMYIQSDLRHKVIEHQYNNWISKEVTGKLFILWPRKRSGS